MTYYESLQQWKEDMEKFSQNPNDKNFLEKIKDKVFNSEYDLRKEIKDYTVAELFKTNPLRAMLWIAEENPHKMLFIKSKSDPFFKV